MPWFTPIAEGLVREFASDVAARGLSNVDVRRLDAAAPDLGGLTFDVLVPSLVPPVRLHDLRHGAATLALAAGVDLKTVQAMLGHSTIVTTADIYNSVLPELQRDAAAAIAALVLAVGRNTLPTSNV